MVKGIFHAGISTRDMKKSLWFYCEVLGGTHIMEIEEPKGTPWIECVQYSDGTAIELFYPRADFPLGNELGRNHTCFATEDILALEKKLDECGVEITSRPKVVRDKNWQMWCKDPNGYPVEFIQLVPDCPQLNYNGTCVVLS